MFKAKINRTAFSYFMSYIFIEAYYSLTDLCLPTFSSMSETATS